MSFRVGELKRVCMDLKAPVCLQLAELRHMDDEGIEVLLTLLSEGAQILSINPYFDLLLKSFPTNSKRRASERPAVWTAVGIT
jgi:hypothetical protein